MGKIYGNVTIAWGKAYSKKEGKWQTQGFFLLFEDFFGRREYGGVTLVTEDDWCGYGKICFNIIA